MIQDSHFANGSVRTWNFTRSGYPHFIVALRRANDVDDRLAFLHVDRSESALERRHHLGRIGDLLAVAVGNFDSLLIIRDAIQERDRLVLTLGREAVAIESDGRRRTA